MKKNPENLSKIIIPKKDDNKNQELLENLEAISDEDIMKMGEKFERAKKRANNPENENEEKNVDLKEDTEDFEIVGKIDGSNIEYDKSRNIVKWKGGTFDLNNNSGEKEFISKMLDVMLISDITEILPVLNKIFGGKGMKKIYDFLS